MHLATRDDQIKPVAASSEHHEAEPAYDKQTNDRRVLEDHSSQSGDHLQILARATNDAVRDWDVKTGRLCWPQGLDTLLGYCRSSVVEEIGFWHQSVHPEDLRRIVPRIADALNGNSERWSDEYRFRRADGNYIVLLERALIIRDASGRAVRFVASLMDVTARKQLQDQICRSQRMEAFGQLAAGVAHDFNNFLTTILGYSDLILAEANRKSAVADHIKEIRGAAGRASALTSQLLAFSRKQALESRVVDINSLITNLERSLLRLLGDNIHIVCHLHDESDAAHIKVDPGQFNQVIVNVAVNARDAMPQGGQLTIRTSRLDVAPQSEHASVYSEFKPGEYVLVSVSDTGEGMTDEVKAHLFEPFFTTKDTGSGLGLATAYGIVRQSGGQIQVQSEPGKGTTVQIYFPRVPALPPPPYKKPSAAKLPTGTETILVLEDDISVRHVSIRILRSLGYNVIEAANGDDAQRLISQSAGEHIDLLLTDVVMPQMSGRFFADWLRKLRPRTKVIFVSGYLSESLNAGDKIDRGTYFLPKPFDPEQLAQTIRRVLDG
ncbi:MAG TPA: ATP-binding protein [Chthoniobacterales bacterium]|nr:ATP-binding protein [Chthoniobacterales bacterium]